MAATDSSLIEPSTMSRPVGLFDLPGELKNAIYRFALVETQHLDITTKSIPLEPALLRTCRVIRQEARSIFYLENTFRILSHNGDMVPVLKFCAQHHLIEDGIRILVTRENLSSRDDFGSSKLDNEIDYIGAWYSREVLMHPCQTNSHYVKDGRLRSPGVRHRLWDMARMLKKENVDWEVTRKVLDSAADLTLAEMSFRPQLSASCCSIPTDVAWFDASDT